MKYLILFILLLTGCSKIEKKEEYAKLKVWSYDYKYNPSYYQISSNTNFIDQKIIEVSDSFYYMERNYIINEPGIITIKRFTEGKEDFLRLTTFYKNYFQPDTAYYIKEYVPFLYSDDTLIIKYNIK